MKGEYRRSERRACELVGRGRSSCRYRAQPRADAELGERLRSLAGERRRFGYRRLTVLLRREGWAVNPKHVYRLYQQEGLAVRPRQRKRLRAVARTPLAMPVRADQVWTMDFPQDALASGGKFRTLNLMDGYTREALRMEADTSLAGARVVRVLAQLRETRGVPEGIQGDYGPEFISPSADGWTRGPSSRASNCTSSTPAGRPRTPTSRVSTASFGTRAGMRTGL